MGDFIVYDLIEGKNKKFYNLYDAEVEAKRLLKIYSKLNSRVRMNRKDYRITIFLKEDWKWKNKKNIKI